MAKPRHPLRDRCVQLMRQGQAMPGELARLSGVPFGTLLTWRRRERIETRQKRAVHVLGLLIRGLKGGADGPVRAELKRRLWVCRGYDDGKTEKLPF